MSDDEFLIEDYCDKSWTEFLNELNDEYDSHSKLFESANGSEISQFISLHSEIPVEGRSYYFVTTMWLTNEGAGAISSATSDELYAIISIEDSGRIIVENTVTGKRRSFPEVAGPVTRNTQASALFESVANRDNFLTLFMLKFSNFRIKTKIL